MKKNLFFTLMLGFSSFTSAAKLFCDGVDSLNTRFQVTIADSNLNLKYFKIGFPSEASTSFVIHNYYQDIRFETFFAIRRSFLMEHYIHLYFSKNAQTTSYVRFGKSGFSGPDMGLPIKVKCHP